jgi:histidine decarboxylase
VGSSPRAGPTPRRQAQRNQRPVSHRRARARPTRPRLIEIIGNLTNHVADARGNSWHREVQELQVSPEAARAKLASLDRATNLVPSAKTARAQGKTMIRQRTPAMTPDPITELGFDAIVAKELDGLRHRLEQARPFNIGFPGATDFDYTALAGFFAGHLLNNIGDPYIDGAGLNDTKAMEREVVGFCADLFRAPADNRWGYVTSGGSEGNLYALHLARTLLPRAVVYFSDTAHYSVDKSVRLLDMAAVRVRADQRGEIDYDDLATQIGQRRHRPAVIVATIGTTMTEAVDDVHRIAAILDTLALRNRFIHADAALSGIPLALLDPAQRPGFDMSDGADSIAVSGHKFLGSPIPCGVVVVKACDRDRIARTVSYTASPDATISGSRSGHAPLMLWHTIRRHGLTGLRRRADHARELAAYALQQLDTLNWAAYRHQHAFTVVMKTPPEPVLRKWVLATANGCSHLITMPGITIEMIDAFMADMTAATSPAKRRNTRSRTSR